jgi:hypothetical protein
LHAFAVLPRNFASAAALNPPGKLRHRLQEKSIMSIRSCVAAAGLALAALFLGLASAQANPPRTAQPQKPARGEKHPHIYKALRELRAARATLESAAHDYGGHRVTAIGDIDQAIVQLDLALRADPGPARKNPASGASKPPTAPVAGKGTAGKGTERHPHIYKALRELKVAKVNLEEAARDYKGHRVAALRDVDHAINQLHDALRFDRK